mmetsp:Transcript_43432/g.51107  ORF Transcript_43432/g.51107 Transcript_43432/m.51107 type:complete len:91 (-) Transcript_43432:499-771(-)
MDFPKLWPAYSRRLVFFMNIKKGRFRDKIDDFLREEHLMEIGKSILINKRGYYYQDLETRSLVKICYYSKFFCNFLINRICEKSEVIQKA